MALDIKEYSTRSILLLQYIMTGGEGRGRRKQDPACHLLCWLILSSSSLVTFVFSKTDSSDVSALNVMYTSMNSPQHLSGWKSNGGDPCREFWKGVTCSGSKVTEIDLSDYGLSGSLGYKLTELTSVTYFDVSKNNFKGSIPYQLPPKVQRLDLSGNEFNGNVPYSISEMNDLKDLDLNHNKLNGQLSNMFAKLSKLTKMDLSFNSLSGDLPQSFENLSSLSTLHLQNNQFTGYINVLADLSLDDLNIEDNKFTGWIPDELNNVNKLQTGGNSWSSSPAPPPPPGTKNNQHSRQSKQEEENNKSGLNGATISGIVLGVLVVLGIIIALFSRRRSAPPPPNFLEEHRISQRRTFSPLSSRDLLNDLPSESHKDFRELKSFKSSSSFRVKSLRTSPSISLKPPPSDHPKFSNDNEFTNHNNIERSYSVHVTSYSLAELQTATGNFTTGRLLGEGSIGRVYKAKYADGKVLAVKKIDSSLFQGERGIEFSKIVSQISKLHHPNISELVGYCSEQRQNMLVYEYFRNGSLHEFLHMSDDFSKPLTWNTRVKIALETARAIEYLHEVCSPSYIHKSIKSSNILLDMELNPHLSNCGFTIFHERTSQNLGSGYNAPECTKTSVYSLKSDIYSFGVVMLELMTGRVPFNSQKPKYEQSLVLWAAPQLHDIDALAKMVDPALRGLYPPKSLSRFADIIALCVQPEPEFRPPMSEVVEALVQLVQRSTMNQRGGGEDLSSASCRTDESDY